MSDHLRSIGQRCWWLNVGRLLFDVATDGKPNECEWCRMILTCRVTLCAPLLAMGCSGDFKCLGRRADVSSCIEPCKKVKPRMRSSARIEVPMLAEGAWISTWGSVECAASERYDCITQMRRCSLNPLMRKYDYEFGGGAVPGQDHQTLAPTCARIPSEKGVCELWERRSVDHLFDPL